VLRNQPWQKLRLTTTTTAASLGSKLVATRGNSGQNGGRSKKAKKHCDLCDKHGGPASSHNTDDCRIYKADGTKKGQSRGDKKSNHSFAQLEKKLEKAEKKLTKMSKKMDRLSTKRPKEESDSSDSDA
jgi:hypothetical protein